MVLSRSLFDIL